jgi:fluoride ion exporter CrcB/FEX
LTFVVVVFVVTNSGKNAAFPTNFSTFSTFSGENMTLLTNFGVQILSKLLPGSRAAAKIDVCAVNV